MQLPDLAQQRFPRPRVVRRDRTQL